MSENQIYIVLALVIALIIIVVIIFYIRRKTPTIERSLENRINQMTNPGNDSFNNPTTPAMYGAQNVIKDAQGIWRLAPGTCELFVTGIVDWGAIQSMTQTQKEQLFFDLENCKGENIPLLQP